MEVADTAAAVGLMSSVIGFRFDLDDRICYLAPPILVCLVIEEEVLRAMALDFSFFFFCVVV